MKTYATVFCLILGAMLIAATGDFPDWGDPDSPASRHLSPYYITHALHDAEVPNIVTGVLADYRGFDTMLETSVVLIAGLAVSLILRRRRPDDYIPAESQAKQPGMIIKNTAYLLVPPGLIFSLYVLAHGHHSPGGGFQAGVILGAILILYAFAFGLEDAEKLFPERAQQICMYSGVILYAAIGLVSLVWAKNFLDYSVYADIFPISKSYARSLSILGVETGVTLTVASVMFSIYADLASSGYRDQGL